MVLALRPALHGALLDAVGMDAIALQSNVTGFTVSRDRVTLQMANGVTAEGQLLVGADGIGSAIRRAIHPGEPPPRSSGIVAVRGVVHGALHHLGDCHGVYYLGRGVESMLLRASDTGIYWFLSLARQRIPVRSRNPSEILRIMSQEFDATFRAVTSATEDLRCEDLVDRDPLPFWGKGVVTLLGDAAHPVLPHTGQGAAQAIVDAVTLGKALNADPKVASALRSYEDQRRGRTAILLRQGRRTARIMGTVNPVACWAREAVLRSIPVKPFVKTFVKFYVRINRRAGTDIGQ